MLDAKPLPAALPEERDGDDSAGGGSPDGGSPDAIAPQEGGVPSGESTTPASEETSPEAKAQPENTNNPEVSES